MNEVGNKYGRLTVMHIKEIPSTCNRTLKIAVCVCECGNTREFRLSKVKKGDHRSCGCRNHGLSKTKAFRSWTAMKTRCKNHNAENYERYGGSGIMVCDGLDNFRNFHRLIGDAPTPKHTLDRINPLLHYSCGSCDECKSEGWIMNIRWATYGDQNRNKSCIRRLCYGGEAKAISEWADVVGISRLTISARIAKGWNVHDALYTKPLR